MWLFAQWSNRTKGIVTAIVGAIFLISVISDAATVKPELSISDPAKSATVTKQSLLVEGTVTPEDAEVKINGQNVTPNNDGTFDTVIELTEGSNEVRVIAINGSKQTEFSRSIIRELSEAEIASQKQAEEKAAEEEAKRKAEEQARLDAEQKAKEEKERAERLAQEEADQQAEAARWV